MSAIALLFVLVGLAMFGIGGDPWTVPSLLIIAGGLGYLTPILLGRW